MLISCCSDYFIWLNILFLVFYLFLIRTHWYGSAVSMSWVSPLSKQWFIKDPWISQICFCYATQVFIFASLCNVFFFVVVKSIQTCSNSNHDLAELDIWVCELCELTKARQNKGRRAFAQLPSGILQGSTSYSNLVVLTLTIVVQFS